MTYTKITPSSSRAQQRKFNFPRLFLIITIIVSTLIVAVFVIGSLVFQPERQVKDKITALATDYYENTIYQKMLDSTNYSGDPAKSLEKYQTIGLSIVTLDQLLSHDSAKTAEAAKYLKKYCNLDATYVKFYPEPPYSRTDYRINYTYSCNF